MGGFANADGIDTIHCNYDILDDHDRLAVQEIRISVHILIIQNDVLLLQEVYFRKIISRVGKMYQLKVYSACIIYSYTF